MFLHFVILICSHSFNYSHTRVNSLFPVFLCIRPSVCLRSVKFSTSHYSLYISIISNVSFVLWFIVVFLFLHFGIYLTSWISVSSHFTNNIMTWICISFFTRKQWLSSGWYIYHAKFPTISYIYERKGYKDDQSICLKSMTLSSALLIGPHVRQ